MHLASTGETAALDRFDLAEGDHEVLSAVIVDQLHPDDGDLVAGYVVHDVENDRSLADDLDDADAEPAMAAQETDWGAPEPDDRDPQVHGSRGTPDEPAEDAGTRGHQMLEDEPDEGWMHQEHGAAVDDPDGLGIDDHIDESPSWRPPVDHHDDVDTGTDHPPD